MTSNLSELYHEIAEIEGGEDEVNIAQISEIFSVLGHRWREMSWFEVLQEVDAIRNRAGTNSGIIE